MEEDLLALLHAEAGVTALVPAPRITWFEHLQGAGVPYVALQLIDNTEGLTLKGPDGLFLGRVQVDVYATRRAEALSIARAIRRRLHGHRGARFQLIRHVATRSTREGGSNEPDRAHRISLDLLTSWSEQT